MSFDSFTPSVTVLIPTYNRAQYLGEALNSVLEQETSSPSQIIVVDDGSKDNTREVVAGFGPPVEYLAKQNGGKSSALNLGLRHARGALVWIMDDDDFAERDALRRMIEALQGHPECGFAFGDYDLFTVDKSGRQVGTPVSLPTVKPEDLYLALMEQSFILQGGLLVRKACYDEVGGFDENNARSEDLDMVLRLARRFKGVKAEGVMFHQRQHSGLRGPEAAPVAANRMVEGWLKSDRRIFNQIYTTQDLREFLPNRSFNSELTDEQTVTALMQRGCIMARKGIWTYAAGDFQQVGEIARRTNKTRLSKQQIHILRRVFDLFSYAPHAFGDAREFRRALDEIKPAKLQCAMRAAMIWPLPFTIGAALLHGHTANFYRFLRIYFQLATPEASLHTLFNRSFFSAGLELLRRRKQRFAPIRTNCKVIR